LTLTRFCWKRNAASPRLQPGRPLSPDDEDFLRQIRSLCQSATAMLDNPADYRNPWLSIIPQQPQGNDDLLAQPQYFFSGDGTLAFLLVRPRKEAGSFNRRATKRCRPARHHRPTRADFPGLEFGLTGFAGSRKR